MNNKNNCLIPPYDMNSQGAMDYGPQPLIVDINCETKRNKNFRSAFWTGKHLQLTLMSIPVNGEIGLETHPHLDQFLYIEAGRGLVMMGDSRNSLDYQKRVGPGWAVFVPAGIWHNLVNTSGTEIKLFSVYAPPQHPYGTVHKTKADADAAEGHDH